jgi:hypothetical protein
MKLQIKTSPSEFISYDSLMHSLELGDITTNLASLEIAYDEATQELAVCTSDECVFIPKKRLKEVKKRLDELFALAGVK